MAADKTADISLRDRPARAPGRVSLLVIAALFVFTLTRLWWLLNFDLSDPLTSGYYAVQARLGVDVGQTVYQDFALEYPPVAWWLIAAPRWLDHDRYPGSTISIEEPKWLKPYLRSYSFWFHIEMMLADIGCLVLMIVIGRQFSPTAQWLLPLVYSLGTIVQPWLLFGVIDLVLLLFLLLFVTCWLKSLDTPQRADAWAIAAYFVLGLAVSFKIVPVVFVPFLLLADLWAVGSVWGIAGRLAALAVAAVGPFLLHAPSAGWNVLSLFRYHGERGVHLESIWGSAMLVARWLGVPCEAAWSYGAYDAIGDLAPKFKAVASLCVPAAGAALGIWSLLQGRRFSQRLALDTGILALVNSTVLAHVYSTQYSEWLLPMALILALNTLPKNSAAWGGFAGLAVAILAISSWLIPHHFRNGLAFLEPASVTAVVVRSVCLLGLALLLNMAFFAKYRARVALAQNAGPARQSAHTIAQLTKPPARQSR